MVGTLNIWRNGFSATRSARRGVGAYVLQAEGVNSCLLDWEIGK